MEKILWSMLALERAGKAKPVKANQQAVSQAGESTGQLIILTTIVAMMEDQLDTTLNNQRIT